MLRLNYLVNWIFKNVVVVLSHDLSLFPKREKEGSVLRLFWNFLQLHKNHFLWIDDMYIEYFKNWCGCSRADFPTISLYDSKFPKKVTWENNLKKELISKLLQFFQVISCNISSSLKPLFFNGSTNSSIFKTLWHVSHFHGNGRKKFT